jgi:hypothetical protein
MEQYESIFERDWGLEVKMNKVDGINEHNFIDVIKVVLNKCTEINKKKILVDLTHFSQKLNTFKLFEAVIVTRQTIGAGSKLAFIAPHLVKNDKSNFVETAGFNRSVFIQYFTDKETAMEWLLKDKK